MDVSGVGEDARVSEVVGVVDGAGVVDDAFGEDGKAKGVVDGAGVLDVAGVIEDTVLDDITF